MVMVDNIAAAFCQADPANEEIYLANADAISSSLPSWTPPLWKR